MEVKDRPLFEAQEALRIISERINLGLFKTDENGFVTFVNPAACDLLNIQLPSSSLLKFPDIGPTIFGSEWNRVVSREWKKATNGETGSFEVRIDDRVLHFDYYPIRNGSYLGTVGIIRDVTDERTVLRDLYELKRELANDLRNCG